MDDPALHDAMRDLRERIATLLVDERAHTPRPAAEIIARSVELLDHLFVRLDLIERRVKALEHPPKPASGR